MFYNDTTIVIPRCGVDIVDMPSDGNVVNTIVDLHNNTEDTFCVVVVPERAYGTFAPKIIS